MTFLMLSIIALAMVMMAQASPEYNNHTAPMPRNRFGKHPFNIDANSNLIQLYASSGIQVSRDNGRPCEDDNCGCDTGDCGCHPKCKWRCHETSCNQECTPVCKQLLCQTKCLEPKCPSCQVRCKQPTCRIVCPVKTCMTGTCPECRYVCDEPECHTYCTNPTPQCHNECEKPDCKWNCHAPPGGCPKPECALECERHSCKEKAPATECECGCEDDSCPCKSCNRHEGRVERRAERRVERAERREEGGEERLRDRCERNMHERRILKMKDKVQDTFKSCQVECKDGDGSSCGCQDETAKHNANLNQASEEMALSQSHYHGTRFSKTLCDYNCDFNHKGKHCHDTCDKCLELFPLSAIAGKTNVEATS